MPDSSTSKILSIAMKQAKTSHHSTNRTTESFADLVTVKCRVTAEDYEKMIYYFDSGMVDITTKNAIAIALRRLVEPGHLVQVVRECSHGAFVCVIDGHKFRPSRDLEEFLARAEHGFFMDRFSFEICLPRHLVNLDAVVAGEKEASTPKKRKAESEPVLSSPLAH